MTLTEAQARCAALEIRAWDDHVISDAILAAIERFGAPEVVEHDGARSAVHPLVVTPHERLEEPQIAREQPREEIVVRPVPPEAQRNARRKHANR